MPFEMHTVEVLDGSNFTNYDKLVVGVQNAVAHSGASVGTAVTVAVSFSTALPSTYAVFVDGSDPNAVYSVPGASKTNAGFNVVITPVISADTLAAGTFDVLVVA
jgi:hypothetical protein